MLDLKHVVSETEKVEASLQKRNASTLLPKVQEVVVFDKERKAVIQKVEELKQKRNVASQEIAKAKREGKDSSAVLAEMKVVADEIKVLDEKVAAVEGKIKDILLTLPNILEEKVVAGKSSAENKVVREWGKIPRFSFKPLAHFEIGEKMGILDFKKAGEVTGARFVFLKGIAAKLERALIRLMLETHVKAGYEEIAPPFLVNRASLTGTGTLPKFIDDVFHIEKQDFFLIPTAEVPLTNYHREEILEEAKLPLKYVAYSPCFRSEAGSYGKDTKGLKRQHQFEKVELVQFCKPQESFQVLESLTAQAEKILQLLSLPYRVVELCSGDTSFSSAKTYDIEVWCPSENAYVEISSCSCFTDFQARRANIRYRDTPSGKVQFVHTLNGSGLAVGRTLLAIMENFQTENGEFTVPEVLKGYM